MKIPESFRGDVGKLPPVLRALLEAELLTGNSIVEVGHSFPAPPVGAYIKLAKPITTRPRSSGEGLRFRALNSSLYAGEFTDDQRFYFILEPPGEPPAEPDMDAIRAARSPAAAMPIRRTAATASGIAPTFPSSPPPVAAPNSPLQRFQNSLTIDYEKWHDGIGYDLEALRAASPEERESIETILLPRAENDWRDVEALAALNSPRARAALQRARNSSNHQIRAAVARHAPDLVSDQDRTASIVQALQTAPFYGGLTEALNQATNFHPAPVMEALWRGALQREGETAVHFAAMLMFLHGEAAEPFDWAHRPFFLRFHSEDRAEREAVFRELCEMTGVDPSTYLGPKANPSPGRRKGKPPRKTG